VNRIFSSYLVFRHKTNIVHHTHPVFNSDQLILNNYPLSIVHYPLPLMVPGAGVEPARDVIPRDFKSLASTNFATRACKKQLTMDNGQLTTSGFPLSIIHCQLSIAFNGGWGRNRTGVNGFAGRCMTTLPPSQGRASSHNSQMIAKAFSGISHRKIF
jgi:hypothetical protein